MPAYCNPDNVVTGNRHTETRDLDIAAIAKMVRADIRDSIKAGNLPKGIKVSVRISRFSMGQSLDATVTACPVQVQTSDFIKHHATNPSEYWEGPRYTRWAIAIRGHLQRIIAAYNRENVDTMSDYFDVRFYSNVRFD